MHALKKLPVVEADVAEAAEWYETRRSGLGERFILAVQSVDKLILAHPFRFSIRFADVRRLNMEDFPYGVFFFLDGELIIILAVLHTRRDTRAILERRRQLA